MRRRKAATRIAAAVLTLSVVLMPVNGMQVSAQETEEPVMELLTDDTESVMQSAAAKNAAPGTVDLAGTPYMSALTATDNTDANNASFIVPDCLQFDKITKAGEQRWYFFETKAGKITLDLNAPNSAETDYDLYIYSYNDTESSITMIGASENVGTSSEHLAMLSDGGIYFVMVNGYSGYDAVNEYQLGVCCSSVYDAAEADDTMDLATVVSMPFHVTGTIDNAFDFDFIKFTLSSEGAVTLSLTNNGSTDNIYRMDLYNSSGTAIGYLTQGQTGRATLAAGNYYIRTCASTYGGDYKSTYTLTGSFATSAARVNVTSAGDALINYGQGKYWRIDHTATVKGTAYDSKGNLLPNANIEINVPVIVGNVVKTAAGTTDSQGNFSIHLDLGPGAGQNVYDSGVSYHYYDVVPIYFYSNGSRVSSNISYIYHFAYSIYHSH